MPVFYIDAVARYRANATLAISQLNEFIQTNKEFEEILNGAEYAERWKQLQESHSQMINRFESQAQPAVNGHFSTACLINRVRRHCPKDTIWCVEAVTQTGFVGDQIQASIPGSWINCGGGGLGWSGGAALGIKLATEHEGGKKFVCQIVGGMLPK